MYHTHSGFGESFIHSRDIYWTVCQAPCEPSAFMELQSSTRDKYVQCHWVLSLVTSALEEGCGLLGLRIEHVGEVERLSSGAGALGFESQPCLDKQLTWWGLCFLVPQSLSLAFLLKSWSFVGFGG